MNRSQIPKHLLDDPRVKAQLGDPESKLSKYRAISTEYNGVRYHSKAEAIRARELDQLKAVGHVVWWIGQPVFRLGVAECKYVADFLVVTAHATPLLDKRFETPFMFKEVHAEDVKGVTTSKFARDAKLWRRFGPCPLHLIKRGKCVEVITSEQGTTP